MPEKDSKDSFYYLNAYQDADERGSHTAQGGQHYAGKGTVRPAEKTCGGVG